jgi:hypothetical protein
MRVCGMRTGIAFTVDASDRARLEAIVAEPFIWTANPDKIIAAVDRGRQVLDSIH